MDYRLASTIQDIESYVEKYKNFELSKGLIGYDVEGRSLDVTKSGLTGFAISLYEDTAIYIPLAHQIGNNLDQTQAIDILKRLQEEGFQFIMQNAKYDKNVTEINTGWAPSNFSDSLEMIYMENPDRKSKGLKSVVKEDYGFDMTKFEQLFTSVEVKAKNFDISTKAPEKVIDYVCADADWCRKIFRDKYSELLKIPNYDFIMNKVDIPLIDIVRDMERDSAFELNTGYIDLQVSVIDQRVEAFRKMLIDAAGVDFEPNSPKQLGNVLFDTLGLPSGGMTLGKNPQHKTDAKTLEKLSKSFPIAEVVVAYRKLAKAKSTYFKKLKLVDQSKIPVLFNFNMFAAPTFRFAAPGGSPEKDGACGVNIQAVSNGDIRDMIGVEIGNTLSDRKDFSNVNLALELPEEEIFLKVDKSENSDSAYDPTQLPYVIPTINSTHACIRETCSGCIADCKGNGINTVRSTVKDVQLIPSVRHAFRAPDGWEIASFDYDRQELVIGANMSKEPSWIDSLLKGEDLHVRTASTIYGMDVASFLKMKDSNPDKYSSQRAVGKTCNFAVFYGAQGRTISQQTGLPLMEAERVFDSLTMGLPVLFTWMDRVRSYARREGFTTTYFGRRRYLNHLYKQDFRMQAFADRSAVNTAIQGTGADIIRMAMVRTIKRLKESGFGREYCKLAITLHDELVFVYLKELREKILPIIRLAMMINVSSWPVQLTVGAKIGEIWGKQEEYRFEEKA